jgi:hypothetical protein
MKSLLIFISALFLYLTVVDLRSVNARPPTLTFALANIVHVPADAPTIQQGIDQAQKGDTVLVAEGHYYENIFFRGKEITVASEFIMDGDTSHISKTIIDGSQHANPDSGSVVYFINGETLSSAIIGFTITGGSGSFVTDRIYGFDDPIIKYHITGGGIKIWAGGRIERNRIINNDIIRNNLKVREVCGAGGGIEAIGWNTIDTIIIKNNEIKNNNVYAIQGVGAGIYIRTLGFVLCENNIINENIGGDNGGGICVGLTAQPDYSNFAGEVIISCNLIKGNQANAIPNYVWESIGGGGIEVFNSSPIIYNNIILGNSTTSDGGGINLWWDNGLPGLLKPILINNTIFNNSAHEGGGIYIVSPSSGNDIPIIFNNVIWNNTATLSDSGFYIQGNIHLENSLVQDSILGDINNNVFCADPLFADTQGRLSELSPCLGSGVSSLDINGTLYQAPSIDFDGNPRPSVVDPLIDLGAYESDYAALAFPLSFSLSSIFIQAVTGTMHFTSEISNYHDHDIHVFSKVYGTDGSQDSVELLDDGQHGDGLAGDALYGTDYQISTDDIFATAVAIQNNDKNIRSEYPDQQKFTTIGPLVYKGYTIVTTGDSHIDPGETHRLKLQIQNSGQQTTASNITAKITPLDTLATMVNNIFQFNDIPAGQTVLSTNYRSIRFSKYFPGPIDTVRFAVEISSDGYIFWRDSTFNVVVGVESEQPARPVVYSLKQNYPNPFNPNTNIEFTLPRTDWVTLKVYNVLGQQVSTLVSEKLNPGIHKYQWQAEGLPSGVYYCRMQAGEFEQVRKMILLR